MNCLARKILAKLAALLALMFLCVVVYAQDERSYYFPKQTDFPKSLPKKEQVWIFIMAGQSNMAGRGVVEPQDTIPDNRLLTINEKNEVVIAKEPLHFYEPNLTGLDCGLSFGKRLLKDLKKNITVLIIPVAVGGSSSRQWLGDSLHRNVKLMTNFRERVEIATRYGTIKGILWHQGEADADPKNFAGYEERLEKLFTSFRMYCNNNSLPILMGELGSYSDNQNQWNLINEAIRHYAKRDKFAAVIETADLKSKSDKIHFDSEGQRKMGDRMAVEFIKLSER